MHGGSDAVTPDNILILKTNKFLRVESSISSFSLTINDKYVLFYLFIYLFITYNRNRVGVIFVINIADVTPFAIAIVISKLLKRQSKARRRAPAYSLAM